MLNPAKQASTDPQSRLFSIFQRTAFYSQKITSFFQVYEDLFSKYVGKPITFVEVGVSQGGSLFMWREYFGSQARIIGIELNPLAKKWEKDGFEIFIGDQGSPEFWADFFRSVGKVDVLLDDGGHTNIQQIVTVSSALDHINDGGLILIEDVHTSYMPIFGNPSQYSFVNYAKTVVNTINSRMDKIRPIRNAFFGRLYSVAFFESMVAFHVDSRKAFVSTTVDNGGAQAGAQDMRALSASTAVENLARRNAALIKDISFIRPVALRCFSALRSIKQFWVSAKSKRVLREYFHVLR